MNVDPDAADIQTNFRNLTCNEQGGTCEHCRDMRQLLSPTLRTSLAAARRWRRVFLLAAVAFVLGRTDPVSGDPPTGSLHHPPVPCPSCYWGEADFLLWWSEGLDVPPLLTSSPAGAPANTAGILGQPGTVTLVGDEPLSPGPHAGGRFSLGWWANPSSALLASYLRLGERTAEYTAASDEVPILARPVVNNLVPAAMLIAHPDFLDGSVAITTSTELQSLEALWRRRLFATPVERVDLLVGYRFADLDESLRIDQFSRWFAAQGNIIPGTTKELFDRFLTQNEFHGAELGLMYERSLNQWTLDARVKIGLGNNRATVQIDGSTVNTVPNAGSATFVGGLLAQQTNIGRYQEDHFAVVPEVRLSLARQVGERLRFFVGYDLLLWSNVARPGDQIDVHVSQFPPEPVAPAAQPAFRFATTSFWAQGLHAGIELRF